MSGGGDMPTRDVHNYSPPKGPTNINDSKGPGIHGDNCGNVGEQNDSSSGNDEQSSGSPGIAGTNYGNCGSQQRG